MTEVLALIPARGGSKGIPRKNIRLFAGFPLIVWSIAAAKQSEMVTRILISTDDDEIASVAREYGAETPFLRPSELAQDQTTDLPVFEHALKWLEEVEGYRPEVLVQLRPTSPIRPRGMVDKAIDTLLSHKDADCVRGVVRAAQNPYKMWCFEGEDKPIKPLLAVEGISEPYNAPRQILPPVYWQTGHIDAIRFSTIANKLPLAGEVVYPLVIENIKLIISDFDGVLTDNRVWTDQNGTESVVASRSDSMKIKQLREIGIETIILSSEPNPVVLARAKKMGVEAIHGVGISDKGRAMREVLERKNVRAEDVVYIGNDWNDLPCFEIAGWAVAVADAYPEVIRAADYVLSKPGGHGALREVCELVLENLVGHA